MNEWPVHLLLNIRFARTRTAGGVIGTGEENGGVQQPPIHEQADRFEKMIGPKLEAISRGLKLNSQLHASSIGFECI